MGKKKGISKLNRTEVATVRFDPRLRFAVELAARKQRRTISSFIEWAVEKAVKEVEVGKLFKIDNKSRTAWQAMAIIWRVDDAELFLRFVKRLPTLLSYEQEELWDLISKSPYFWQVKIGQDGKPEWLPRRFRIGKTLLTQRVQEQWETLNKIVAGEVSFDAIPREPLIEIDPNDAPPAADETEGDKEDILPMRAE